MEKEPRIDIRITSADVDKWRDEVAELDKQIRNLQSRRDRLKNKVNAVRLFLHDADKPQFERVMTLALENLDINGEFNVHKELSLPELVRGTLRRFPKKLDKLGLRREIINAGIPEKKLGVRFGYYYSVVSKMEDAGEISH